MWEELLTFIAHISFIVISITFPIVIWRAKMFVQGRGRSSYLNKAITFIAMPLLNNTKSDER